MKNNYIKEVVPKLKEELGIKNLHALPAISKVTVNVGLGSYVTRQGKKDLGPIVEDVKMITGQKPNIRKSKKAISNFKLREGMPIGVTCTLRGKMMYEFLAKLIHIVMPRIRDFQGISAKAFDGKGNYSIGFKEHTIFPEINVDNVENTYGIQINISTTAKTNYEGYKLLKELGFPFRNEITK